jgi:hypothetical protein
MILKERSCQGLNFVQTLIDRGRGLNNGKGAASTEIRSKSTGQNLFESAEP